MVFPETRAIRGRTGSRGFLPALGFAAILSLPASPAAQTWSYIQNDSVKLGVRLDFGAGIAFFSKRDPERNLLNHADHGRLLQQSYYGDADGSLWNGKPWRWNPVQGGCWTGKTAGVVDEFRNDGKSIYARTRPVNWAGCEVIDAVMEQTITLAGNMAHIRFRFSNPFAENSARTHQEMPAVFVDHALPNLVSYQGKAPWTDAPLTRTVPGWPNAGAAITEAWAAYVDGNDWGIGVYTPGTTQMTYYRYEGDGKAGPAGSACSYFAPVRTLVVAKGFAIEYDVHVYIGKVAEMRKAFRAVKASGTAIRSGDAPRKRYRVRGGADKVSADGRRRSLLGKPSWDGN